MIITTQPTYSFSLVWFTVTAVISAKWSGNSFIRKTLFTNGIQLFPEYLVIFSVSTGHNTHDIGQWRVLGTLITNFISFRRCTRSPTLRLRVLNCFGELSDHNEYDKHGREKMFHVLKINIEFIRRLSENTGNHFHERKQLSFAFL